MGFQRIYHLCHCGRFLPDGNIDADHILALLVQDRIHGNGSLPGLPVPDDQLTLSAADGEHGVNGKDPGFHGHADRLAVNDPRRLPLNGAVIIRLDLTFPVDRLAQRVDHASDIRIPYRHAGSLSCPGHLCALADPGIAAEKDAADLVPADILHHTLEPVLKCNDLAVHGMVDPVDPGDPVADGNDSAHFTVSAHFIKILYLFSQDRDYLI